MFRLIKYATYGILAYTVYEIVKNVRVNQSQRRDGEDPVVRGFGALGMGQESDSSRSQAIEDQSADTEVHSPVMGSTDPQGMRVQTKDSDGATMSEVVGRGVVRR